MLRAMSGTIDQETRATTPEQISQKSARELSIRWADGAESLYEVRALRLACGCASCVDEWSGEQRIDPAGVPADVHPLRIESVGRYAIAIEWSDGHSTGIYPFDRLRALGRDGAVRDEPGTNQAHEA